MSYEPQIIVDFDSLIKHKERIEYNSERTSMKKYGPAYKALRAVLQLSVIEFSQIRLIIFTPEGTEHNKNIRSVLDVLDVEYKINY